jgi:hypothetical protein
MEPGCIGKSHTNNLLAPGNFLASQISAMLVLSGIVMELEPMWPILKMFHLREKGGADPN